MLHCSTLIRLLLHGIWRRELPILCMFLFKNRAHQSLIQRWPCSTLLFVHLLREGPQGDTFMSSKEVYDKEIMPLIHQLVQKAREHKFPSLIAIQVDQAVYI